MAVSSAVNSGTFEMTTPSDREIRLTRLFNTGMARGAAISYDRLEEVVAGLQARE